MNDVLSSIGKELCLENIEEGGLFFRQEEGEMLFFIILVKGKLGSPGEPFCR